MPIAKEFTANTKAKNDLVFIMLTMMFSLIAGCGESGSSSDARLPVRMAGDIPDDLADDICLEFCQPDPETLAPFLISDVDLNALSESERIAILRIFDDDLPVVMIRPTFERMKALLDLIGLEMEDISRDIPKFWGVQTSQEFEIYTYVFDDPAPRQIKTMDIAD